MGNKFGLANLGFGMGLRAKHYPYILENWPKVDWFEIISENYMDTDGRQKRVLEKIAERYPIVMHGVSMSIGSTDPLNKEYLKKLKTLADWIQPKWISDHLCWTGMNNTDTHDLLPVPYTQEALNHIADRIRHVQDFLGRPLILENPSTYLEFKSSQMPEWEFIGQLAEKTNCGLLLDVNNVYVSCFNHGWDEKTYFDAVPKERVVQIHLAGHENNGTHLIDTHEGPIIDPVWELYKYVVASYGPVTTMVEWDTNIPEFETVMAELEKAKNFAAKCEIPNDLPSHAKKCEKQEPKISKLKEMLPPMHEAILSGDAKSARPEEWIPAKENFLPKDQLGVYINAYRLRLHEIVSEDFPVTRHYLGENKTDQLIYEYVEATKSHNFNLSLYALKLPEFARTRDYLAEDRFAIELIELETAITKIFDWRETKPLNREKLSSIAPEQFIECRLTPREALQLYSFEYPVSEYYKAVIFGDNPVKPQRRKSYLAIYRHEDDMQRLELEENEYKLLKLLFDERQPVGNAIEALIDNNESVSEEISQKFQEWLGRWVNNGLLAA